MVEEVEPSKTTINPLIKLFLDFQNEAFDKFVSSKKTLYARIVMLKWLKMVVMTSTIIKIFQLRLVDINVLINNILIIFMHPN